MPRRRIATSATCWRRRAGSARAWSYLRRALALAPDDVPAAYDLGTLLLEAERFDEAEDALRRVVRLRPDHAEAHNNLGIALASQGRVAEARREFEAAVGLKPDFEDAQRNLARLRLERGARWRAERPLETHRPRHQRVVTPKPNIRPCMMLFGAR